MAYEGCDSVTQVVSETRSTLQNLRLTSSTINDSTIVAESPRGIVSWAENTIDNEFLNKKKSKRCCVFHKPKAFGESDSSSDEDDVTHKNHRCSQSNQQKDWSQLPLDIVLVVVDLLLFEDNVEAVQNMASVCGTWRQAATYEPLWHKTLQRRLQSSDKPEPAHSINDVITDKWRKEVVFLHWNSPCVLRCEVKKSGVNDLCADGHSDEVLHVGISHDGNFFGTVSKDGSARFWAFPEFLNLNSDTVILVFKLDFRNFDDARLKYTQFVQYSPDDRRILVSGVSFSQSDGKIFVLHNGCACTEEYQVLTILPLMPFDLFGGWFNSNHILFGRTFNVSGNPFVRHQFLALASIFSKSKMPLLGNSLGYSIGKWQLCFGWFSLWHMVLRRVQIVTCSSFCLQCRKVSSLATHHIEMTVSVDNQSAPSLKNPENECVCEKYLLVGIRGRGRRYACSIVVKIITTANMPWVNSALLNDTELLQQPPGHIDEHTFWLNHNHLPSETFDYAFFLPGVIIGTDLSQDQRFLYVNVRPWLSPPDTEELSNISADEQEPPQFDGVRDAVSDAIELYLIDLSQYKFLGRVHHGAVGITKAPFCFFLFTSVCNSWVVSGSEDGAARLWNHHYSMPVAHLHHKDVVNGAAFAGYRGHTVVTVSDDGSIKVWESKRRQHQRREKFE